MRKVTFALVAVAGLLLSGSRVWADHGHGPPPGHHHGSHHHHHDHFGTGGSGFSYHSHYSYRPHGLSGGSYSPYGTSYQMYRSYRVPSPYSVYGFPTYDCGGYPSSGFTINGRHLSVRFGF